VSDDLGFSETQLKSIGMIVHALYNNPKVLYAPNNTAAKLIISKVNYYYFICTCATYIHTNIHRPTEVQQTYNTDYEINLICTGAG